MRKVLTTAMAGVMLATSGLIAAPEAEARRRHHDHYYGNGYYQPYYGNGYYYQDNRRHRRNRGNEAAAAIAGFALGAIIAGTIANSNRGGSSHQERCARRYRSYDPRTDTYIGRDGNYYYCRL